MDVAAHCTRSALRNPSRQYYIVNTALRNGWIVSQWAGNRWKLYLPDVFPDLESGKIIFDAEGGFRIEKED